MKGRLANARAWRFLGVVIALGVLALSGLALLRPKAPLPASGAKTVAELESYLTALTRFGTPPGLSLVVVKDGALVYQKGFGLADGPRRQAATADTVYGWWSMTKIFTAAAIFQLEEGGRLRLDDPVAKHLPFFRVTYPSPYSPEVTLRQLLNHSSGIPNNVPALVGWIHHADAPRLDQTAYIARVLPDYSKLAFEPGDHGEYTNLGYMLLGAVIEAASGESYEDYVRRHLLQPLGMGRTDFVYTEAMLADAATASHPSPSMESVLLPLLVSHWSSYVRETAHGRMWLNRFYANSAPPTGLIGPATDAARFASAVLDGGERAGRRILSDASVKRMFTETTVTARHGEADLYPGTRYGLGWHIVPEGTRLRIQHRGGGPGFGSEMRLYPTEHMGMVVIANDTTYDRDVILDLAARLEWRPVASN
ncbi:MAG: serine hydrolase domain-containing protein [Vicinamibacteria bacterium]